MSCYLFLGVEDLALHVPGFLQFFSLEVRIIQSVWEFDVTDVQLRLCCDNIDLVDTSQRTSVQLVWT